MAEIQPLVAGNWKMNGLSAGLRELDELRTRLEPLRGRFGTDVMICPPATLLSAAVERCAGSAIRIGGQDCHGHEAGAHTGDISAEMIRDAGAGAVIVGHSERRADHGETSGDVAAKAKAAWRAGLVAIVCVGETEVERRSGETLDVIHRQIAESLPRDAQPETAIIAYEPVWAIGTGLTPTVDDVAEVHGAIREQLADGLEAGVGARMRILYGGSVKPSNAIELMGVPHVNGALVGGASLRAGDFFDIVSAYQASEVV